MWNCYQTTFAAFIAYNLLFSEAHRWQEVIQQLHDFFWYVDHAVFVLLDAVDETLERARQVILQRHARSVLSVICHISLNNCLHTRLTLSLPRSVKIAEGHDINYKLRVIIHFYWYLIDACAICRCSFQTALGWAKSMSFPPSVKKAPTITTL